MGYMTMKKRLFIFLVTCFCLESGMASATVFSIDEFEVIKNGQTYWLDTFSNTIPPQDTMDDGVDINPYNRVYLTRPQPGLPGPEVMVSDVNGKLQLDTAQGFYNIGVVNPVPNLIQRARIQSPTNPDNAAALTVNDNIVVSGLFDLIEPQLNYELYSIRLTDWTSTLGVNEGIELAVRKGATDQWLVEYRQAEAGVQWNPIESWDVTSIADFSDYEQISLSLFNNTEIGTGHDFTAQFSLFDLDGALATQTFMSSATGSMFQVSEFLRPEFTVRKRVLEVSVPEASSLYLLSLGLLGLLGAKKRKS